ncbi:hypothetical protein FD754_010371 [Muntiacus muntjak]|uniref:40S ribosomal protein S12 n=1 Tax=Muntiacus muntjak TaxID=9888 RepID=A0A5N3WZJ8_MUNMU|nr:hypothetical protein FD754_010371 [Muntiacus muntjak]
MAEEGIVAGGVIHINPALQEVLKTIIIHDGLAGGTHKAATALDKCQVHLCMLSSNCDEPIYFHKNIYFCFLDYAKAFHCVDHNKLEAWRAALVKNSLRLKKQVVR